VVLQGALQHPSADNLSAQNRARAVDVFFNIRAAGYTAGFGCDCDQLFHMGRGNIRIKFPSKHEHVTVMAIKETNYLDEWPLRKQNPYMRR
jgi:hypothetical protein